MRLLPKDPDHGWVPYVWLVYIANFLVYPILGDASTATWIYTGLGVSAFLPLYFWGYWLEGRRVLWAVGGMLAIGTIFAPFNAGASVFFVYAACFLGEVGETRVAFGYLGGLLVLIGLEAWLLHLSMPFWISALVFSALLGPVVIHGTQRAKINRKLLVAQSEVKRLAQVAERERIARDLHDVVGHTLSLIVLKSELASKLADKDPVRAFAEIRDVERISRDALAEVRSAIRGYRSAGIEEEFRHARQMLETAGIEVESAFDRPLLSPAQENALVLALREAVTNVVRHAGASKCRIRLRNDGTGCELEVADNGRGGSAPEGSGLSGMRHRIEALGGAVARLNSGGTTLRVTIPRDSTSAAGVA